jgi:hypothetical protein
MVLRGGRPARAGRGHDLLNRLLPNWWLPTGAEIAEVAEAVAEHVVGEERGPTVVGVPADHLPDTWPHDWPSWRSTNMRVRRP